MSVRTIKFSCDRYYTCLQVTFFGVISDFLMNVSVFRAAAISRLQESRPSPSSQPKKTNTPPQRSSQLSSIGSQLNRSVQKRIIRQKGGFTYRTCFCYLFAPKLIMQVFLVSCRNQHDMFWCKIIYSWLRLSQPRLSRITAYLEMKIWSLPKHENLTTCKKYCGKEEKLLLRSNFSSFPQYFQYISNFKSPITHIFVKCG